MVKKIKDLTVEQFIKNCRRRIFCTECPLSPNCLKEGLIKVANKQYLEEEVEINESDND